jgi:hypothetical protein
MQVSVHKYFSIHMETKTVDFFVNNRAIGENEKN